MCVHCSLVLLLLLSLRMERVIMMRSKLLTEGVVTKRYPERPDESGTEPDSPSPSIVHGPWLMGGGGRRLPGRLTGCSPVDTALDSPSTGCWAGVRDDSLYTGDRGIP